MRGKDPDIRTLTPPSGLRVACTRIPGARVEYCGVAVRAGSRDDGPEHPGLAHFVEHTIFKGTQLRSSWHIINRMERVGGELNAYTTKEETVVYTAAPAGNAARAIELLADLVTNSRFPDSELDKEREVVADEINSYLDTPADAVYDDFEERIFAGSPLAHNILGNDSALAAFDSGLCRAYLKKWYAADNMSFFYSGSASPDRICSLIDKFFSRLPLKAAEHPAAPVAALEAPFDIIVGTDTHQAHTVMGARTPGLYGNNRYPLALLTNILGGPGMNSRLNVALREKRGYVYSVEASTSTFTDCGEFNIYFGCDPKDLARCKELAVAEIDRLAQAAMSASALAMAKKQYIGQLAVAGDSRESAAIATGRAMLFYGRVLSPAEITERVQAVSADELMLCAQSLLPLSSLTLS